MKTMDAVLFKRILTGGAKNLRANVQKINDLNVFPVPDGDTGTNMCVTFETGLEETAKIASSNICDCADALSHGSLLGARGNSGVILSQFFKGLQKGLKEYNEVTALDLVGVYKTAVSQAYHAVVNPVEGTILTVFKEAVNYAEKKIDSSSQIEDFYREHLKGAEEILPKTKEMLDVLKEFDVIDSGGAGYLCIVEGMYNSLINEDYNPVSEDDGNNLKNEAAKIDISAFTRDSELEFGYCTECLLRLQTKKVNPDNFDVQIIIDFLNSKGGESIVCYKEDDVVKLHVHTPNPGDVLNELRKYGEFLTIKIENLALQHQEIVNKKEAEKQPVEHKKLAVVTVANGEGIKQLFSELGADVIINGGQTGNPPVKAFLDAFEEVDADYIAVLPNNSNIILTAKQAKDLYKKSEVVVLPSKSIQQGYSALSVINPFFDDIEDLICDVQETMDGVAAFEVAAADKDANLNGMNVVKGDYIGISDDTIFCVSKDRTDALNKLLDQYEDIDDKELLTVFCGKDVTEEEKNRIEKDLQEKYSKMDVTVLDGGQDVYSFYVALE